MLWVLYLFCLRYFLCSKNGGKMHFSKELKSEISNVLKNDGVIAFVTDTVWGLGCLPSSEAAVKKIYEIKKREAKKPLILMSNKIENLKPYVEEINKTTQDLIDKYFPGALTLVLKKSANAPDYMTSGFDTVGVRVPENTVFAEICEAVEGHVLATTSANLSSEPSAKTYEQAIESVGSKCDLVVPDFGFEAKGLESTVAFVTGDKVNILRQGAVVLSIK